MDRSEQMPPLVAVIHPHFAAHQERFPVIVRGRNRRHPEEMERVVLEHESDLLCPRVECILDQLEDRNEIIRDQVAADQVLEAGANPEVFERRFLGFFQSYVPPSRTYRHYPPNQPAGRSLGLTTFTAAR